DYPPLAADRPGAPLATWAIVHTLFEGSQRALFSMLFGAGMLLMVGRLQALDPAASVAGIYYRRILLLMAFGVVDAFVLLWPADILLTYGWCGLLLYPLRRLRARTLLLLALGVIALAAGLRAADWSEAVGLEREYRAAADTGAEMAAERRADWERREARARPRADDGKIAESIRIIAGGSFAEFYRERATASLVLQTVVAFNAWFLDALAGMLIGMFLLRTGVLTLAAPRRTYLLLAAGGYLVGLPIAIWEAVTLVAGDFNAVLKARHLIHYDLRRLAMAFGHLGCILLFARAAPHSAPARRLAAVGRMALSNYLGQSVLCGLVFYTVGLGLYGRFTGFYLYGVVLAVWALQLSISQPWLTHYRFGPAEWLWRRLTYGRGSTPFRRAPAGNA
ncbi:MAG: DUF418 domain-containing protein, partial [Gammaproteobacteria bacterium]|nr:DUF418 domain-containing protein [Gammaproteobacteria bacterium]